MPLEVEPLDVEPLELDAPELVEVIIPLDVPDVDDDVGLPPLPHASGARAAIVAMAETMTGRFMVWLLAKDSGFSPASLADEDP